jgi:hypothetical protein
MLALEIWVIAISVESLTLDVTALNARRSRMEIFIWPAFCYHLSNEG